jgi:ArsR family transcriptional regulator
MNAEDLDVLMMINMNLAKRFDICQCVSMTSGPELCCPPLTAELLDDADAAELATVFKALGDPIRVRLLSVISASPSGEVCACDLPAIFDRSQPTMSHHLSVLTKVGLLEREQRGKWAWFRLRPAQLEAVARALEPAR